MDDVHVRRSGDDYAIQLLALLPNGPAWPRDSESVLFRVVRGLAQIFGFVDKRAADLLEIETDPTKTAEMLSDWERNWGLPDICFGEAISVDQRRRLLIMKMTLLGGQSRQFFIDFAAYLGYRISITEYSPWTCGISEVGMTAAPEYPPHRNTFWQPASSIGVEFGPNYLTVTNNGTIADATAISGPSRGTPLYVEVLATKVTGDASVNNTAIGVANPTAAFAGGVGEFIGKDNNSIGWYANNATPAADAEIWYGGELTGSAPNYTDGDWLAIAIDVEGKTVIFRNITQNSAWSSTFDITQMGTNSYVLAATMFAEGDSFSANFDLAFQGTPPPSYPSLEFIRWGAPDINEARYAWRWELGAPEMRFYWTAHIEAASLQWFRTGSAELGYDPFLRFGIPEELLCVLRRWKPAHTEVIFDITNMTNDGYADWPPDASGALPPSTFFPNPP